MTEAWSAADLPLLAKILSIVPEHESRALAAYASPAVLYRYQARWAFEPALAAICCKSRQVGYSFSTALWAVFRAVFLGENVTVISIGLREARVVLDFAAKHAAILSHLGSRWSRKRAGEQELRVGDELRFASGGSILALPASSGGRSFSGPVLIDELAYHEDPESTWDAASGATTLGYPIRVISTPNGVGNKFHWLWSSQQAHDGWALHQTTIHEAVADGYLPSSFNTATEWLATLRSKNDDPRLFAQMFECSFLDGSLQYVPSELIDAATVPSTQVQFGDCYAGMDFGLLNDLSVLAVVRVTPDRRIWLVDMDVMRRTEIDEQERRVIASHRRWGWKRLCYDATGAGIGPAMGLQKKLGQQRVEPVKFTLGVKEELATLLYQAFAQKAADGLPMIRLPAEPRELSRDLKMDVASLKREVTAAGNVRYDAERTERGHGDRCWALALAIHAISFHRQNKAVVERRDRDVDLDSG